MLQAKYLLFYTLSRLRFLEKYLIDDVANVTSESLHFKIFFGRIPPDHPLPSRNPRLQREFFITLRRPCQWLPMGISNEIKVVTIVFVVVAQACY